MHFTAWITASAICGQSARCQSPRISLSYGAVIFVPYKDTYCVKKCL
jgi:hypothetical protein